MDFTTEKQIRNNVEANIKKAGMTTTEAAEAAGITRACYYKWMTHPYKVPIAKWMQLANAIGCPVSNFFMQ